MSDYAKINLGEVENHAPKFGLAEGIEARFPKLQLGADVAAVSMHRLPPDTRHPFGHRHERQEELYVVVGGGGRMKLDDEVVELARWDVVRVPPETMRAFESGPDGLEYLAFGAPVGGERDSEIVPGWWS